MNMRYKTPLKDVDHIPYLIEGKVVIYDETTYEALNPSKYCNIVTDEQGYFDPERYAILDDPRWHKCIIEFSLKEKVHVKANAYFKNKRKHTTEQNQEQDKPLAVGEVVSWNFGRAVWVVQKTTPEGYWLKHQKSGDVKFADKTANLTAQ